MSERIKVWGSCGGLVAMIAITTIAGLIAYRIELRERPQAAEETESPVLLRIENSVVQVWQEPKEGEPPRLAAEVHAALIEVGRDETRTEISDISKVVIYRDEAPYLEGAASRAVYDEQLKELTISDGVRLAQVNGGAEFECEEIVYYTDTNLLLASRLFTATMGDSVLRTSTARVNVSTQKFQAPHTVAVSIRGKDAMWADSATGDIDGEDLALIGNVKLDSTIGELKGAAESAGAQTDEARLAGMKEETWLRIRAGRVDVDFTERTVLASGRVAVVTEDGSVLSETAEVDDKMVALAGGATITLVGSGDSGPVTVETPRVEYNMDEDLAVCPSPVTATVREGSFQAGSAQARLNTGSWRLLGGVKGTINPGVL